MFEKKISLYLIIASFIFSTLAPIETSAAVAPFDIDAAASYETTDELGNVSSSPKFTNAEALGDIQQAKYDASSVYTSAINAGKDADMAQTQANSVLQAGLDRAKVKEDNLGWLTKSNEATVRADAAYQNARSAAATAIGDKATADNAAASAGGYTDVANNVANGSKTGSDPVAAASTQGPLGTDSKVYVLLAPIEAFFPGGKVDVAGKGLGDYLDGLYKAGIAVATGLALVMIAVGGVQYVSTDAISGKSDGRQRIVGAVTGLLLALGSWLILQQVNPALLRNDLNIEATKATTKLDEVDISLSYVVPPDDSAGGANGGSGGSGGSGGPGSYSTAGVTYASGAGSKVIGGGPVAIDYDGSPGSYKVAQSSSGKYTFRGVRYNSVGYEDLANAGVPGNWWGVKTASDGQPVINGDGTLVPILSVGAGVVNGDTTAFVALSSGQVAAAKQYGVSLKPSVNTYVILSANGKSINAIYADYAGSRGSSYSEISPAAASALGLDFGKNSKGNSYANGNVTISLP